MRKRDRRTTKLTELQRLERRYACARRALDKAIDRQSTLRTTLTAIAAEARLICTHPIEYRLDIPWTHDNGYGRQSTVTGEKCQLCAQYRAWKGMSQWTENYPSSRFRDD
jgi:hypothetical protein